MDKLHVVAIGIGLLIIGGLGFNALQKQEQPLGSVVQGNDYQATSTAAMVGSGIQLTVALQRKVGGTGVGILLNSPRVLAHVVVASSSGTTVKFWNATSTTDSASTTVFSMKAAIAEGTYIFDAEFSRGLVVDMPVGFNGEYVLIWR